MIMTVCDVAPRPSHLCPIIRAEFRELPGLNLTLPQAARLWGREVWLCRDALDLLVESGFLARDGGRYVRADQPRRG